MSANINDVSLATFAQYIDSLKPGMKREYDRGVNRDLSQQHWHELFKRNVTTVLKQIYADSLTQLQLIPFKPLGMEIDQELHELTFEILKPLEGLVDELLQYAIQKHRTSCALSNFPSEHNPSREYIDDVVETLSNDLQLFALQLNSVLTH